MTTRSKNPMQCSMGVETSKNKKVFHFNLIFYFPDKEDVTKEYPFIVDRFNYYRSKAQFSNEDEAALFGTLLSDAIRICVVEQHDPQTAFEMLTVAMDKDTCPQEFKDEIEEFYNAHKQDMEDEELHVCDDDEPPMKKEDLN